jgi:hypothetical protein
VTLQEPQKPSIADIDMPDTEVIVLAHPSPVFVDSTGRRRRMLRKVAYGFGALCMIYGGLVSVSLAGGPVSSSAVLPLPDRADDNQEEGAVVARPHPKPKPVATPVATRPVLEAFPTRVVVPATRPREARAVTPRRTTTTTRPSPKPSAKPSATSAKPVESVTKPPAPTSSAAPTGSSAPPPPVAPKPTVPPNGGGQGGGGAVDEPGEIPAPGTPVEPQPPAVAPPPAVSRPPAPVTTPAERVTAEAVIELGPAQEAEDAEPPAEPEPDAGDGDAP